MTDNLQIVFDCADVDRVSRFWLTALEGYTYPGSDPDGPPGSPPAGFKTWEEWADDKGMPDDQRYVARTIIDTRGSRPDIHFLKVPESKSVKNRLHLDLPVSRGFSPEEGQARKEAEAERLVAAGAMLVDRVAAEWGGSWIVMHDVERNEFCVT